MGTDPLTPHGLDMRLRALRNAGLVLGRFAKRPCGHALEPYMKIIYDPEVDVLRILFSSAPIEESDEDKPGVILDYDKDGNVVGMEILDASKRVENPESVEFVHAGTGS